MALSNNRLIKLARALCSSRPDPDVDRIDLYSSHCGSYTYLGTVPADTVFTNVRVVAPKERPDGSN